MMKRLLLTILFAGVALLLPKAVFAQPSGSYASGIACLNLTNNSTVASISFYNQAGALVTTVNNNNLAPNSPWLLFSPNIPGLPAGFLGSAVVGAGAEVACSVNTQTTSGVQRVGTAEGVASDDTGPVQYATQVLNNAGGGFSSYVAIQNASNSETQVRVTYYDANGNQVGTPAQFPIPGNASRVFYQEQAGLPNGFIGSAKFESVNGTTPLAGAVAIYSKTGAQLLSFNTFKQGASKVFLPRVSKNLSGLGYTAGWACQNLGPGTANMTMQVTMINQANGQTVSATLSKSNVQVGQSWLGYFGSTGNATLDAIPRGFGSAVVTSTGGQIACTVNEDNRTGGGVQPALIGQGATYSGVPDGQQSVRMFFPQIVALGQNSFRGGFQIANTTNQATTCTYTFSNGDIISNVPLAANGSNSVFAETVLINNKTNFNGSVLVECGQPIVGIYNLSIIGPAAAGDPYASNNGINR
jgi:hypothetical protein